MLYSDLSVLKAVLEIDDCDKSEDKRLLFFLEWASRWIEELLDRPGFSYALRTEYLDGNGSPNLLLKFRPVYPTPPILVYYDSSGNFASASGTFDPSTTAFTYGTDFCLRIDQQDGTSRSGILYRINALWPRAYKRQGGYLSPFQVDNLGCVKVVYYAGYTVDNLPSPIRMACTTLIGKMRNFFPLGMEVGNEGYKDRSLGYLMTNRDYLLNTVKDMLLNYRNWNF